jgi:hypothetical protein
MGKTLRKQPQHGIRIDGQTNRLNTRREIQMIKKTMLTAR